MILHCSALSADIMRLRFIMSTVSAVISGLENSHQSPETPTLNVSASTSFLPVKVSCFSTT